MAMATEHASYIVDVIAGFAASGVKVRGERVAIVRDPSATMVGSLHLPDEAQRKEPRGTVVALGRKIDSEKDDVFVGDRVMYTKYSPIHFEMALPDGQKVDLEMFHINDLYLIWEGDQCS